MSLSASTDKVLRQLTLPRSALADVLGIVGVVLFGVGLGMIYLPLAPILAGLVLILIALLVGRPK